MYDGAGDIEDEVRQNARDQQHPVVRWEVADTQPMDILRPELVINPVLGLSQRQVELSQNIDSGQPETGAARERRLEIIYRDIAAINDFLPYMDQVRGFMSTMPHDDNPGLIEALRMADQQLKKFITDVDTKLASLEAELALKKVTV